MNIAEQAVVAIKGLSLATEDFWAKKRAAELEYDKAKAPHTKVIAEIEERFEDIIFELACNQGRVPYQRHGGQERPSSLNVILEGVQADWFENDGPGYKFTASWNDLLKAEQQRENESI